MAILEADPPPAAFGQPFGGIPHNFTVALRLISRYLNEIFVEKFCSASYTIHISVQAFTHIGNAAENIP